MGSILCPDFFASSRQRMSSLSKVLSSTSSFFNGWRSMPGTIPATSQLEKLISITAISVPSGLRGVRDRLRSFNFWMGCAPSVHINVDGCNILADARPIASSLKAFGRRPRCKPHRCDRPASETLNSFGLMQRSKQPHYSITLSASPRSVAGISRPSAGLEVDHEFQLSRRLDPQLAGFVALEDAASVDTNWAGGIRQVRSSRGPRHQRIPAGTDRLDGTAGREVE